MHFADERGGGCGMNSWWDRWMDGAGGEGAAGVNETYLQWKKSAPNASMRHCDDSSTFKVTEVLLDSFENSVQRKLRPIIFHTELDHAG